MVHSFFKLSSDDKKFNIKANVRHGSPLFLPQATHWNSAVSQGSQVTKGGDKRFREILRQGSWKFLGSPQGRVMFPSVASGPLKAV